MPKNVFTQLKEFVDKPNRNVFDMSFTNNLTLRFGGLYPVYCQEVIPGDSFRIKPSFGLRFMPLVFPVQTRMNANLHFFYVRNRNLWKDWTDFIGRTKQNLVPPYINPNAARYLVKTGSLADYLGVPTTLVGDYGNKTIWTDEKELVNNAEVQPLLGLAFGASYDNGDVGSVPQTSPYLAAYASPISIQSGAAVYEESISTVRSLTNILEETKWIASNTNQGTYMLGDVYARHFISKYIDLATVQEIDGHMNIDFIGTAHDSTNFQLPDVDTIVIYMWVERDGDWFPDYVLFRGSKVTPTISLNYRFIENGLLSHTVTVGGQSMDAYYFPCRFVDLVCTPVSELYYGQVIPVHQVLEQLGSHTVRLSIGTETNDSYESGQIAPSTMYGDEYNFTLLTPRVTVPPEIWLLSAISVVDTSVESVRDVTEVGDLSPFVPSQNAIRLSALPFRAYESIYNAFYRNQFNDPFIVDGQKEYNKFIRNNEGGSDSYVYELYNRNYEMDFLTSAKQSPVDGDITPLVGVSGTGKFTFQNSDGSTYQVTPIIGSDGHTLTGIESVQGDPENNSGIRRLMDMVSVGISINDFRNVNSLQRWLETNLRRGYRYKDQLMSHFGVDARYDELDMPEFIGGMSEPVFVNQINQSVDQTGDPSGLGDFSKVLGSFAGQASILAESKHSIEHYCDEHGFIIGILSVTPVPCYSQLLPKYFIKDNVLDYYFPEFGHIGNQPITYKEVCPIQTYAAGDALTDVFGYQRAWYDYLSRVDEVHGDYRLSLDGFLITRVFDSKPELGHDFIVVDDENMSNPFSVTDDGDKILGQVYFKVEAKRPIPKYGIPRLE